MLKWTYETEAGGESHHTNKLNNHKMTTNKKPDTKNTKMSIILLQNH